MSCILIYVHYHDLNDILHILTALFYLHFFMNKSFAKTQWCKKESWLFEITDSNTSSVVYT